MLTTVLAILASVVGIGGIGLVGLSSIGIGGGIIAWFVARNIPWKLVAVAGAIAATVLWGFAAYETYKTTQAALVATQVQLGITKDLLDAQTKRADQYVVDHDAQVARIETLEAERAAIDAKAADAANLLSNLNLELDFHNDPVKATADFNARIAGLNGLLSRASRASAVGAGAASQNHKASAPSPAPAQQRGLSSLWHGLVPVSK